MRLEASNEVLVEKIDLPNNIRKGQPFEARVVVTNYADAADREPVQGKAARQAKGRRRRNSVAGRTDHAGTRQERLSAASPDRTTGTPTRTKRKFVPDVDSEDGLSQNNSATAYTYVRGKGRVLLIEDRAHAGDFDLMIDALRDANIEVVSQMSDELFGSLAELQAYDAVILAGVPRVSGETASQITSFTDDQIDMLVSNTQQLGAGLLMIGGPEAFGAGGWIGTNIEKAMPVDFKIRNTKIQAVGALALIMHASEMADGNHWQKVIARSGHRPTRTGRLRRACCTGP